MRICLDAGHGQRDPGAIGKAGTEEKERALLLAHLCKNMLEENHQVVMTRYGDDYVSLNRRTKIANTEEVDLFVSLHFNSAENTQANGTETYHFFGSELGKKYADNVQESLIEELGTRNRGVKTKNFKVLRATTMPAILVEVAFLSNKDEEEMIKDDDFILKAATGIVKAINKTIEEEE